MNLRTACVPLLLAAVAASAVAQVGAPPPLPGRGPAPLLFVRFAGPAGMRATFYQGRPVGRTFDAPAVVGLRPGYVYRVRLSDLPGLPGVSLYPSVEVRGCLALGPKLSSAAYPAPVVLTDLDIQAALSGALVTKVIYLEDPDKAAPTAQPAGGVLETDLPASRDPVAEARELGRVMLIVRIGERVPSPEELVRGSVYGTILHPGEKALPHPAAPPCVPQGCRPFYDPFLGPKPPEEECLHDGGDRGLPAGLDPDGRLYGLDPEDTVAEWTDSCGRRRLTCSNRVCLCVPRFAVFRTELPLNQYESVVGPNDTRLVQGQELLARRQPSLLARQLEQMVLMRGRERPSVYLNQKVVGTLTQVQVLEAQEVVVGPIALLGTQAVATLTEVQRAMLLKQLELARELSTVARPAGYEQVVVTSVVARVEAGPQVVSGTAETRDLTICCNEAPCPPDKPLVLIKCADRPAAQVGDVVTFFLRYSNHGGRPLTDVAVTDSLSPRLEYVPGSAQSDRNAVFTTQDNGAGSVILRWEVSGRLLPGQTGSLRFQARVR
jgi:uncharacterized repeat protein (TIGR01451 family)